LGVIGSSNNGLVSADTSSFYINSPSGLINLDVEPEVLNIRLGQEEKISIKGLYPNNISLDLSNISDLLVNTDTN
jgi:hypothetical protein